MKKSAAASAKARQPRRGAKPAPSDKPRPPVVTCGHNHRHSSPEQAAECDRRYDSREAKKRETRADGP